jgi:hypothetical protein
MRHLPLISLALGGFLATAPAGAQTYDPSYPVCMKVSGDPTYFECYFTSMAQCREGTRGMSAECVANPYYAKAHQPSPDQGQRAK